MTFIVPRCMLQLCRLLLVRQIVDTKGMTSTLKLGLQAGSSSLTSVLASARLLLRRTLLSLPAGMISTINRNKIASKIRYARYNLPQVGCWEHCLNPEGPLC